MNQRRLIEIAAAIFKSDVKQLEPAFSTLLTKGVMAVSGSDESCCLIGDGIALASRLFEEHRRDSFDEWTIRCESSPAYSEYCRRLSGLRLVTFNAMNKEQLEILMTHVEVTSRSRVLDLGCGLGAIAEYISDRTGAYVMGIDFASRTIARASHRTIHKRERLSFTAGDLNSIHIPQQSFDVVMCIDSLYFVNDLRGIVERSIRSLRPGGIFSAFFTSILAPTGSNSRSNKLGQALSMAGVDYRTIDLTPYEASMWAVARVAADDLKDMFVAEGNEDLWQSRNRDIVSMTNLYKAKAVNRYLYLASGS